MISVKMSEVQVEMLAYSSTDRINPHWKLSDEEAGEFVERLSHLTEYEDDERNDEDLPILGYCGFKVTLSGNYAKLAGETQVHVRPDKRVKSLTQDLLLASTNDHETNSPLLEQFLISTDKSRKAAELAESHM
eukprot:TRINITY_DN4687_c0_g1_i1.p1 TRINITY_DN4687_c0_g1~~TRINITY_DN4687_c0_g1_i1.p1  ORF type:complete len:133 (-),score=30.80 TRINITY_DN4687_c0_g1_i1:131-529(-)